MTHAVELIASALPSDSFPEQPRMGMCCVTGNNCLTLPRKLAIKPSFTRLDLLKMPNSDRVGVFVWRTMNYGPERKSSWWCDGSSFVMLRKDGVRQRVLEPDFRNHWAGYVTTSYKKHGSLLAPVNSSKQCVWLFENLLVDCTDSRHVWMMWLRLKAALDNGLWRTDIENLNPPTYRIRKFGLVNWIRFEEWAVSICSSPLYKFLTHLLPGSKSDASSNVKAG